MTSPADERQLLELEDQLEQAIARALKLWMPFARSAVLGTQTPRVAVLAAGGMIDVGAIASTQPIWSEAVRDEVVPAMGRAFDAGVNAAEPQLVKYDLVPVDKLRESYLADVEGRLMGVPNALFRQAAGQQTQMISDGTTVPLLRSAASKLLTPSSLQSEAERIARTEATAAWNSGQFEAWTYSDQLTGDSSEKEWLSRHDDRVRHDHEEADGQRVPLAAMFLVGGVEMLYPGWPLGPAEQVINCRCRMRRVRGVVASGAMFHLPGQHDQKDHGRWARHGSKAYARRQAKVQEMASAEGVTSTRFADGAQAQTTLEVAPDGTAYVRKRFELGGAGEKKHMADAEELKSRLLDAVGLVAPTVVRISDDEIVMDRVPGKTGSEMGLDEDARKRLAGHPDAKLIGLIDTISYDLDSNEGNWIETPDGRLARIDGSSSFLDHDDPFVMDDLKPWGLYGDDLFVGYLRKESPDSDVYGFASYELADKIEIDAATLKLVRDKLTALRSEFMARERMNWYTDAVDMLDQISARAVSPVTAAGATFHLPGRHDQKSHGHGHGGWAEEGQVAADLNDGKKIEGDSHVATQIRSAIRAWAGWKTPDQARVLAEVKQAVDDPEADTEGAALVRAIAAAPRTDLMLERGMRFVPADRLPVVGGEMEFGPSSFSSAPTMPRLVAGEAQGMDQEQFGYSVILQLQPGSRSLNIEPESPDEDMREQEREWLSMGRFRVLSEHEEMLPARGGLDPFPMRVYVIEQVTD